MSIACIGLSKLRYGYKNAGACTQIGVLQWFARLWEIDQDEYWGYITNCGTEGNLHGILVGRENLPDGILYASRETHYSVFKCVAHLTRYALLGSVWDAERNSMTGGRGASG